MTKVAIDAWLLDPERMAQEMRRRHLRGAELARLAGVSKATVSEAQRGLPCRPATFEAILRAFNQTPVPLEPQDLIAARLRRSR